MSVGKKGKGRKGGGRDKEWNGKGQKGAWRSGRQGAKGAEGKRRGRNGMGQHL